MNVFSFITLLVISFIPNAFYKGRTFFEVSWKYTFFITVLFFISSSFLFYLGSSSFFIRWSFFPIGFFFSVLWFIWPLVIRRVGTYPSGYLKQEPSRFLAKFDPKVSLFKYMEILFQEVSFLYLFFIVLSALSDFQKIAVATVIIGLFHVTNFLVMPKKFALFYFLLSLPMTLIFGILILNGYILVTLSIHICFYIVHNSFFWIPKWSRHKEN